MIQHAVGLCLKSHNLGLTDARRTLLVTNFAMAFMRSEERLTPNEEKTAQTEDSIKRLRDTVEGYIRERRNGE